MAKQQLREHARKMRIEGNSIGEISVALKQPKSTVSYWCKDVLLSEQQICAIQGRHTARSVTTLLRVAEQQRKERLVREHEATELGKQDVGSITRRDLFMLGLGLYWGEGYKYTHCELGFTNSNPDMILTYMCWLERVYGVSKDRFVCRISINSTHRGRVADVEKYWRAVTGLGADQFTKTSLIHARAHKVYENSDEHYGTLRIKVRRATGLVNRILGSITHVSGQGLLQECSH
jgi:hypothetical protein